MGTRRVTLHRDGGEWNLLGLPVELECGDRTVSAVIVQVEDGDEKYRRVMTLKSYDVLSEVICDCPGAPIWVPSVPVTASSPVGGATTDATR